MRCKGKNKDGSQCRVEFAVDRKSGLCYQHNPKWKGHREWARAEGGKVAAENSRKNYRRTASPEDVPGPPTTAGEAVRWAAWATWAVSTGIIDKGTAREVSYGVRTFLASLETAEHEEEIQELKQTVRELQGATPKLEVSGGSG